MEWSFAFPPLSSVDAKAEGGFQLVASRKISRHRVSNVFFISRCPFESRDGADRMKLGLYLKAKPDESKVSN